MGRYSLESLEDSQILEHIKLAKVLTYSNDLIPKFFWKKIPLSWNKNSKFQKTVIQKSPQYERISKNSLPGWQAWRNWLFSIFTFFGSGQFLINFSRCHRSKNDQIQKSYFNEKSVFSRLSTSRIIFEIHSYCDLNFMIEV